MAIAAWAAYAYCVEGKIPEEEGSLDSQSLQ